MKQLLRAATAIVGVLAASAAASQPAPAGSAAPAAAATSPAAPPAHAYVSFATATLPEPGNPLAVMFADVGSKKVVGAATAIDVFYVLGKPQKLQGGDTAYVMFNYSVDCAKKTLRTVEHTTFPSAGAPLRISELSAVRTAVAESADEVILNLACKSMVAGTGYYTTIDQMRQHARYVVRGAREHDKDAPHTFVFLGTGRAAAAGEFTVLVDLSQLERVGDQVTVSLLEVFSRPPAGQPTAGAYVMNQVIYNCTAKTQSTVFTAMFAASSAPLKAVLTGKAGEPRAVNAGTLDERAMSTACANSVPAGTTPPFTSMNEALASSWQHLARLKAPAPAQASTPAPRPTP